MVSLENYTCQEDVAITKGCSEDLLKFCSHDQNIPRQGLVRHEEATASWCKGGLLEKMFC